MKRKGSLRNTDRYLIVDVEPKRSANKDQGSGGFGLASSCHTAPNLVNYTGVGGGKMRLKYQRQPLTLRPAQACRRA